MIEEIEDKQGNVHPSPPLGLLAIVFVVLFGASIATNFIMTNFAPYPTPYLPIDQLQAHYIRFPDAMRVTSFLQLCASIPLGLFTATVVSRLLFFRIRVAGVHIALFGGVAASSFLGISALTAWSMSQPGVASDPGAMRVVQLLAFATGGFRPYRNIGAAARQRIRAFFGIQTDAALGVLVRAYRRGHLRTVDAEHGFSGAVCTPSPG